MHTYWLWLALHPELSEPEKGKLARCGNPEDLFFPDREGLWPEELDGLVKKARSSRDLKAAEQTLARCAREGIRILTLEDERYPVRLKNIPDPPLVLYYKGTLPDLDAVPAIGVVGTRKASAYGITTARQLGWQIAKCGGAVVSGFAAGIDGAAMEGALMAGGTVVGVLGCGVEQIYPKSNRGLFARMVDDGCIISEYPPGTPPNKWNFPRRNRIISGLSSGVLVVEAPEKSGSLITARLAGEQGRDVFVVPGNVDLPTFAGSYHLLREGATPVNSGWDILCEYEGLYPDKLRRDMTSLPRERMEEKAAQPQIKPQKTANRRPEGEKTRKITIDKASPTPYIDLNETLPKLTQEERALVSALRAGPRQADDVIAETGLTTGKFLAAMTMLEIKGIVKRLPGKRIQLK